MMIRLPANSGVKSRPLQIAFVAKELAQRVLNAPSGRLDAPLDAADGKRLAGYAGKCIDVVGRPPAVFVRHPHHGRLVGAHVGCGNVLAGTKKVVARQLLGKASRDPLELLALPLRRIDAQAPLRASKGNAHQRALVRHECRQRLDLLLIRVRRIANAAFCRREVRAVQRAPADERLHAAAQPHAEAGDVGGVADPDLLGEPVLHRHETRGLIELAVDVVEEGLSGHRALLALIVIGNWGARGAQSSYPSADRPRGAPVRAVSWAPSARR